jgi:hypothetical protein
MVALGEKMVSLDGIDREVMRTSDDRQSQAMREANSVGLLGWMAKLKVKLGEGSVQ